MATTIDMFAVSGQRPRRSRRILMRVVEAGQGSSGGVIQFECPKCDFNTGWITDTQTVARNKRGIPCPECNGAI